MIDQRTIIAKRVLTGLRAAYPNAKIEETETTNGCPVIRIEFRRGEAFNLTITRARQ